MISRKFIVHGRVQGVGFRYFVRKISYSLNLKGYVKNLPNGNVEIEIQGDEEDISKFKAYLIKGNGFSRVEDIEEQKNELKNYADFFIKH